MIRRIFVTVRDAQWREVPPSEWTQTVGETPDGLSLRLSARHRSDEVDLAWEGELSVNPGDHEIAFTMRGVALREFAACRVGVAVLHPTEEWRGGTIETTGGAGNDSFAVGDQVMPQAIVAGLPSGITRPFSTLRFRSPTGDLTTFRFDGALFEIEDQRNWAESSLKSYCPPLGEGFPRTLEKGQTLEQTVVCELPANPARPTSTPAPADLGRVPRVGFIQAADVAPLDLDAAHLQVAVPIGEVERALAEAPRGRLDVLLVVDDADPPESALDLLRADDRVSRVLVSGAGAGPLAPAATVDRIAAHLAPTPVLSALDGYVADVNRGEPTRVGGGGVALALAPTVHCGDPLTVVENIPALGDVVRHARSLLSTGEITVSPLTLSLGFEPEPEAYDVALPWAVASLSRLAEARVQAVTFGRDIADLATGTQAAAWASTLDLLARAAGSPCQAVPGLPWSSIAWHDDDGDGQALVANLTGDDLDLGVPVRVLWPPGPHSDTSIPPFGLGHLPRPLRGTDV